MAGGRKSQGIHKQSQMLWLTAILLSCKTHGERYFQKFPTVFIVCGLNNMKGLFFYSEAHCCSPSSCHSTLLVPPFHPSSYHFIPLPCRKLPCYLVSSVPFLNVVSFSDPPLSPPWAHKKKYLSGLAPLLSSHQGKIQQCL